MSLCARAVACGLGSSIVEIASSKSAYVCSQVCAGACESTRSGACKAMQVGYNVSWQGRQGKEDRVRGRRGVALTDDLASDLFFFFGSLCIEQSIASSML